MSQTLRWLRERVAEFREHLRTRYPDDPRVIDLESKLKDVRLLPANEAQPVGGSWRNGKFKHSTGVLYIAAYQPDGTPRTQSSLLKSVVHELAHATRNKTQGEDSHSQYWKQTWLWFLSIATGELGWVVDIKCAECTYYGLCDRRHCPKCNWLQGLCKPYVGAPRR